MASCLYGHGEITAALLDAVADPLVGEQDGFTPAHGAAFQGKVGPMRVLIERGLDWTSFHEDGYAPLHRVLWKVRTNIWAVPMRCTIHCCCR